MDLYKYYFLGGIGLVLVQSLLIVKLLFDRRRRRRAEAGLTENLRFEHEALDASQAKARELEGRLLMAQEDERKRLARELHDDVSQRLAGTAIMAGKLKDFLADSDPASKSIGNLTDELAGIAEDVHRISRQLHPSILDDLGLKAALQSECDRFFEAQRYPGPIQVSERARESALGCGLVHLPHRPGSVAERRQAFGCPRR